MQKLIILFYFFISSICFSQDETLVKDPLLGPHHIGLHAGFITGVGFSYRYWPKRFGIQVTGVPIINKFDILGSSGVSLLATIKDNETVDLFAYLGNALFFQSSLTNSSSEIILNTGIGIGLKIDFLDVLNLNLQAGYGVYNLTNTVSTNLSGEVGLYYNL